METNYKNDYAKQHDYVVKSTPEDIVQFIVEAGYLDVMARFNVQMMSWQLSPENGVGTTNTFDQRDYINKQREDIPLYSMTPPVLQDWIDFLNNYDVVLIKKERKHETD